MFAILGSGFGIYGYLPALVDGCTQRIVLPDRYRSYFNARSELARFAGDVEWRPEETAMLDCAEGVVLALRPIDQVEWLKECLVHPNIKYLLLEKPLAQSPDIAEIMLDNLIKSGKIFRVGYTFRYTTWGMQLLSFLGADTGGRLSIRWHFLAHHFKNDLRNWKRFNAMGGGAIRFYGIHIIALLAEIGYRDVSLSRAFGTSSNEFEKWIAIFTGSGLPECEVVLDSKAIASEFRVEHSLNAIDGCTSNIFADLCDPFASDGESCHLDGIDQRVPILSRLCHSLWEKETGEHEWHDATIKLWRRVEKETLFEGLGVNGNYITRINKEGQGILLE